MKDIIIDNLGRILVTVVFMCTFTIGLIGTALASGDTYINCDYGDTGADLQAALNDPNNPDPLTIIVKGRCVLDGGYTIGDQAPDVVTIKSHSWLKPAVLDTGGKEANPTGTEGIDTGTVLTIEEGKTVTLKYMIITGGYDTNSPDEGETDPSDGNAIGGISNNGGILTLLYTRVEGNVAHNLHPFAPNPNRSIRGAVGGIRSPEDSQLILKFSSVSHNIAISNENIAADRTNTSGTVTGGVGTNTALQMEYSSIVGNTAEGELNFLGQAIGGMNVSGSGLTTSPQNPIIRHSIIGLNKTTMTIQDNGVGFGIGLSVGAIRFNATRDKFSTIESSLLIGNKAELSTTAGCVVPDTSQPFCQAMGGISSNSKVDITDSAIIWNKGTAENQGVAGQVDAGGGINCSAATNPPPDVCIMTLNDSLVSYNSALIIDMMDMMDLGINRAVGGIFGNDKPGTSVTLTNTDVVNNEALGPDPDRTTGGLHDSTEPGAGNPSAIFMINDGVVKVNTPINCNFDDPNCIAE